MLKKLNKTPITKFSSTNYVSSGQNHYFLSGDFQRKKVDRKILYKSTKINKTFDHGAFKEEIQGIRIQGNE